MRRQLVVSVLTLLALCFQAGSAGAQCAFSHPAKAKSYKASLVQAFARIGYFPYESCCLQANTETEGGYASRHPPETFNELSGDPPDGWLWGELSQGSVSVKAGSGDAAVSLKLKHIETPFTGPVNDEGSLLLLLRVTLAEPGGDMTVVDVPVGVAVPVANGNATVKTTLNTILSGPPFNGALLMRPCTSIEIVYVAVLDGNDNTFAMAGVYLPSLP